MSASPAVLSRVVTPAPVRRRLRGLRARGPLARPQRLAAPAGRPVQPVAPVLAGGPVGLRLAPVAPSVGRRPVTGQGVQLTDRGILVVALLMAGLFAASMLVGVASFLRVSDAPLDDAPAPTAAQVALVGQG